MGKRFQTVVFLVMFFILSRADGQNVVQSVSYVDDYIKAESFERNTYGHKIFSSLALNNVKGLAWTIVKFKGRVLIQTEQTKDGHLFAYSKLIDYSLSGEDHFRDFPIDSLLVPEALSGRLIFTDNRGVNIEVPAEILLSGGVIDLSEIGIAIDSLAKLNARIKVDRFVYTKGQWEVFEKQARQINFYYAYSAILGGLVEKYTVGGINRNQSSSTVFIAWHELSRVNNYIRSHNFSSTLNLYQSDPEKLLIKFDESERLEKRAGTLYNQLLLLNSKSSLSGKRLFCQKFTDLSEQYNTLSDKEQPYIASGFEEVVRIFPDEEEFKRIRQTAEFYDVFPKIDSISTIQTIYNNYLHASIEANKSEKFVLSLDLLYNAALIGKNFQEVKKSSRQSQIYAKTLDGLMSSYLKVAIMAYAAGSFDMADNYYEKAMGIYELHQANLEGESLSEDSFLNFIEQQVDLAYGFMADQKYFEGLRLVDQASVISGEHSLDYSVSYLDSAYSIGYLGIYKEKLDSIGNLIENTKIEQALSALELAAGFSSEKEKYIHGKGDEDLTEYALSLFEIYFKRGRRLMKSKHAEEALFAFLDARSINETYIHQSFPELDSLIYNATVPLILDLIKQASFETWANRMDNADSLYHQAKSIQLKYDQTDNEELNVAFAELVLKMENRVCVNLDNKLFELRKKTENRIKSKKYDEADLFLSEAFGLIESNPNCKFKTDKLESLRETNQPVFDFYHGLGIVEIAFSTGNYTTAIDSYLELQNLYQDKNLERFRIEKPDLHKLVLEKESVVFTNACIEYFIQQKEYDESFFYLTLLNNLGVSSKKTKNLQIEIGKGIAESNRYLQPVENYTKGDKWFRFFKRAYMAN